MNLLSLRNDWRSLRAEFEQLGMSPEEITRASNVFVRSFAHDSVLMQQPKYTEGFTPHATPIRWKLLHDTLLELEENNA
jgi:hypothetical protein